MSGKKDNYIVRIIKYIQGFQNHVAHQVLRIRDRFPACVGTSWDGTLLALFKDK